MLRLPDPVLVVLVGPSASGKSHWATEHFRPEQVISSDTLRGIVGESQRDLSASADAFAVLELIVAARVSRRLTTVIDTLGTGADRRREWLALARKHQMSCVAVIFDTSAAECRRRNTLRPTSERLPQSALNAQFTSFTATRALLPDEGFDQILAPEPVRVVPPAFAGPTFGRPAGVTTRPGESADPATAYGAPGQGLRFGLQLSRFDLPGGPAAYHDRLSEVAAQAEQAGFESIWVMDHFRQIPQAGRPWEDMPESTATLGYLAAATQRATIGCLVNGITYRNIAHLGRIVATLDVLSGGRARCGLGAAWFEAEHTGYGWPFPPARERLDLLEDALQLLPQLWGPGQAPFTGTRITVPETICYPRPIQERIPILVGGAGEKRTLRLVAQYAGACNLMGDAATVRRKLGVLQQHCAAVGRDPAQIEVTHLSTVLSARDDAELSAEVARRRPPRNHARWAAQVNPGTTDDHVLRARTLQAAGVQHLIVSLTGLWDSPAIERFADVISTCR